MNNSDNNNIINLVRGDYLEIVPLINIGSNLVPSYIDFTSESYRDYKIFFGVMEPNQAFEDSILYKQYLIDNDYVGDQSNFTSEGYLIIKLYSEDTYGLHPGKYNYALKLQRPSDYQISTIINKGDLNIL